MQAVLCKYGVPIYVKHEFVHNNYVISNLRDQGVIFIEQIQGVPDNSILIFSVHGASKLTKAISARKN